LGDRIDNRGDIVYLFRERERFPLDLGRNPDSMMTPQYGIETPCLSIS
jgi:hypothetical protein